MNSIDKEKQNLIEHIKNQQNVLLCASQLSKQIEISEVFKIMEYRLYYYIATPSAVFVWITGLYMAYALGFYNWIAIKFIFVKKKISDFILVSNNYRTKRFYLVLLILIYVLMRNHPMK